MPMQEQAQHALSRRKPTSIERLIGVVGGHSGHCIAVHDAALQVSQ